MKKLILCCCAALAFFSCSSTPKVKRVDANTQTDLSGYWNDTDVRIVCDSLIKDCLESPRVNAESAKKGKIPVILVSRFRNEGDEHIDTAIISETMETAIFKSGKADFVAGGSVRDELRAERWDQQSNAGESSAKRVGNETGADFLLTGSVKIVTDKAGNTATRAYFVRAELSNIETNQRLWLGENSSIKKVIKRSRVKL